MSPLPEMTELCLYNQRGFCKFREQCNMKHENEICENRNECTNQSCRKRHPRECRYFVQFGRCKLGEVCAYSHAGESKNHKVEKLEQEVKEMKEENMKVDQLEKEVQGLKAEVNNIKLNMARMYKLVKANQVNNQVNSLESGAEETDKKEETKENSKEKKEQKFMCDKCDYSAKKKVTLSKHMNTKHCIESVEEGKEQTNGEGEKKNNAEEEKNNCVNCVECDKCDYLENMESCEMCNGRFENVVAHYAKKGCYPE